MKPIYTLLIAFGFSLDAAQLARADDRGWHRDDDLRESVERHKPRGAERKAKSLQALQCGDVITTSIRMTSDLNCPTTTGFALHVVGSNVTLDGDGHRISAPNAVAALFVSGSGHTVKNVKANGVVGGDGILAYEAPGVRLVGNDVSGNLQGIVLYADSHELGGAVIDSNVARNNLLFGIRTGFDVPGNISAPVIRRNDVANSGSYGLLVKAGSFELSGGHGNNFDGSTNGIYVAAGSIYLHDFSLAREGIRNIGIFADSNDSLTVTDVDVSSTAPATAWQSRIGLDVYRAGVFSINGLTATGCDVGIKFETEHGAHSRGLVTRSTFRGTKVAGILVESYDDTSYGDLRFLRNCFKVTVPAARVLLSPGTIVGPGSVLDDGINSCGELFYRDGNSCGAGSSGGSD